MENEKLDNLKREMKQRQVAVIKEAVQLTLEKMVEIETQQRDLQNKMKIIKHDIFDLKDGRLDRVLERQSLNDDAKSISVIAVKKAVPSVANVSPWYEDYEFIINKPEGSVTCKVNNSMLKTHASGSYKLKDGTIRYL